ncbi:hypothetical protein [Paraburkholderia sp. J8-2]|uniref:hypothetical protein n=1 Tax=Paraburkholderia sp. J8-2 TaxID=2805440 RepID=UPI002AB5F02A|nr:hypothetical protein [Paraburkholderia sp. J8-2]
MRTGFIAVFAATLIAAASMPAFAGSFDVRSARVGWQVHQPERFMVSGVLRKNGAADVIKPIQAIVVAGDSDAAVKDFARTAQKQYPGYSLIATLASPVPNVGTCVNSI